MKKLILIALLGILCLSVKAQIKDTIGLNLPIVDDKIVYEGVVEVPGKTKSDLYQRAQQWFVDFFKGSDNVIQNQDKDAGLIVGKGMLDFNARVALGMTLVVHDKLYVKIICKDNKYKYFVYDMTYGPSDGNEKNSVSYDNIYRHLIGTLDKVGNKKIGGSKTALKDVLTKNDIEVKKMIESIKLAMNKKPDNDF
jgi:hypothetical protein